jgi:hypothetical protein
VNRSLKPSLILTLTILFLALVFPAFAQEPDGLPPYSLSQSPYLVGERLTYNVSFSNFPDAAHVEVEVMSRGMHFGREAIQLRAHVETNGVINVALFAINNDYMTYVDPATGLPFRSEESARDAIKSADSVQDFNQPAGNEAIPPKQKGSPGTYDFISAFYRARALPLATGGVYDFTVRGQGVDYQAELKVVGHDVIRTNVGSFPAIVTEVKVSGSPLKNLKMHFSDDERHVPVLITARIRSGDLTAELAGSELIKPPDEVPTPTPAIVAAPLPKPVAAPPALGENLPFKIGEQLNYQVFIGTNNTTMGTASFQVRARQRYFDHDGVLLSVTAQTTGAAAALFVARDQIESYVDPKALLPFRTVMNLVEGRRRLSQTLSFDQNAGAVVIDSGSKLDIPVGTHDYVSFFYALRTFNFAAKKRQALAVLVENQTKTLFIEAQEKQVIELGNQRIPALGLSITTDDPQPDKYQFRLWISDDRQRLPLRLTCATKLGPLRADLAILPTTPQ